MYQPVYVRATVTGEAPIRDSLTRESVEPGGQVVLLVREPGTEQAPPCPRHPKKRAGKVSSFTDDSQPCYCGGIVVEFLVQQGAIGDVEVIDLEALAEPVENAAPATVARPVAPKAEKGKA